MPEKNPMSYELLTYVFYAVIAMVGGLVKYAQQVILGHKEFKPKQLTFWLILSVEVVTSAFVGILVFYVCEGYGLNQLYTASLAGVLGHQGANVFELLRKVAMKKAGVSSSE